jgi:sodium-coupled neutral amino acid transporter 11
LHAFYARYSIQHNSMAEDGAPLLKDSAPVAKGNKKKQLTLISLSSPTRSNDEHETFPEFARRQSSFASARPDGAPRTPNRVRFDLEDSEIGIANGNTHEDGWIDEDDYLDDESRPSLAHDSQRLPLLTDMEAPSVRVAMDFDPEAHLEDARPRSNMQSAFMNMANSIM